MNEKALRIGTRNSDLARWQAEHARALLGRVWPALPSRLVFIRSQGDRQSGPLQVPAGGGVFTAALSEALQRRRDRPRRAQPQGPADSDAARAWRWAPFRGAAAPPTSSSAVTGSRWPACRWARSSAAGSPRRSAQLLHRRPDLEIQPVRGNVHTRVERLLAPDSPCDALVLAEAGLLRLGLGRVISERLSRTDMLPAPGQGALALQCRAEAGAAAPAGAARSRADARGGHGRARFPRCIGGGLQRAAGGSCSGQWRRATTARPRASRGRLAAA